jgi:predicted tellurium resistance membrane protein TerC
VLLDIVFSLDSVITAVGMADEFWVMAAAVVIAVLIIPLRRRYRWTTRRGAGQRRSCTR